MTCFCDSAMSLQSVFAEPLVDSSAILRGKIQGGLGFGLRRGGFVCFFVCLFLCLFILGSFNSLEEMH